MRDRGEGNMNKEYRTFKNYDYKTEFKFVGYGVNAEPIYAKYETKFNIANGVVYQNKFVGYCNENTTEYIGMVR